MNTDNPYAAPKSVVADVDPATPVERPPQVDRATRLLWIALVVGIGSSIINFFTIQQPDVPRSAYLVMTIVSMAIGLAIWIWLIRSAARGKNWARITQLVFVCFGVLSSLSMFVSPAAIHWSVWVLYVVQTGLNVAAMAYMFSGPANDWFRALKR